MNLKEIQNSILHSVVIGAPGPDLVLKGNQINKPKNSQTDQSVTVTAVTKEKPLVTSPKATPTVPTLSYCFWCRDENHT